MLVMRILLTITCVGVVVWGLAPITADTFFGMWAINIFRAILIGGGVGVIFLSWRPEWL